MPNWSFQNPDIGAIPAGSVIDGGNFSQAVPDTPIMVARPLTINGGNFTNVRVDPEWTVNGGNFCQVSRCAHLYPKWVAAGHLSAEVENCVHVIETIEVVGGDDVYVREDAVQ